MSNIRGYVRVSTKWQLEYNSMKNQRKNRLDRYSNAEIKYSAKFKKLLIIELVILT